MDSSYRKSPKKDFQLDGQRVQTTRALFKLARTPRTLLKLSQHDVAKAIKPCRLYHTEAQNMHSFCHALLDEFDGVVPKTQTELMSLPGIGRKCADIVLQFAFDIASAIYGRQNAKSVRSATCAYTTSLRILTTIANVEHYG